MRAWIRLGESVVSRQAAAENAARVATGFAHLGVGLGDVVAVMMRNDVAFAEAAAAAGMLGAYVTPVNWHNASDEARYIFVDSGAKAVVMHADIHRRAGAAVPAGVPVVVVETPPDVRAVYGVPDDAAVVPSDVLEWRRWHAGFAPRREPPLVPPGSMIYTSGTTGRPKGVKRQPRRPETVPSFSRLTTKLYGVGDWLTRPHEIVAMIPGPLYHSTPNAWLSFFYNLGANLVLEPRFDPEGLLRNIERHGVTHLLAVPTMFVRLLRLPPEVRQRYDLSSLRYVMHGAAPCPIHVKRAMIDWWGPIIHEHYGGTETGAVVFCDSEQWLQHPGTAGRILPNTRIDILGPDGAVLPPGQTGEIACWNTDYTDFTYHGDDAKRARADRDGLMTLGDMGYLDAEGYLYISGRASDMVISGGVNIYPAEIEAELHKLPGVADCAVFGIPDDEFGEQLYAVVQPVPGATLDDGKIQATLRSRLAGYKVPRRIEFRDALPREDSGKIFKRILREPFWRAAGRQI